MTSIAAVRINKEMATEHVQTRREIEGLLAAAGIHPRKRFGQHFLVDGNLMRLLAASAELDPHDMVLEVGPGTGGLTDLLAGHVQELLCVEIDRDLHAIMIDRFAAASGVTILQGDILESKHAIREDVARAISGFDGRGSGSVKLVANLPYQVATPLIMNLLISYPQVTRLCFTVQQEVADRLLAKHACKEYGPLSIVAQTACRIATTAQLPPHVFWPRPAVGSAMLRMDVKDAPLMAPTELQAFSTFVRSVFDHRRKTLRSALGFVVEDDVRDRVCRTLDATRRPESFSIDEWLDIFRTAHG